MRMQTPCCCCCCRLCEFISEYIYFPNCMILTRRATALPNFLFPNRFLCSTFESCRVCYEERNQYINCWEGQLLGRNQYSGQSKSTIRCQNLFDLSHFTFHIDYLALHRPTSQPPLIHEYPRTGSLMSRYLQPNTRTLSSCQNLKRSGKAALPF